MKNFLDKNNNNINDNYDMQTLINIVWQGAATTNQVSQQLGLVVNSVNVLQSDMRGIKDDINQLKLNEEVTTTQQENIIETARRRVCEILDFDNDEIHKYMKTFISRLYTNARTYTGLGSKISRTKKGDYQRVMDFIEAWEPKEGCGGLKNIADERAESRRRAKEQEYDC